jgi:diguanylate cyclase (GGDEF)-like protein
VLESRTHPPARSASRRLATLARAARTLNGSEQVAEELAALAREAVGAAAAGIHLRGADADVDPVVAAALEGERPEPSAARTVAVPLTWDDEVHGALWVRFARARTLTADDLALLEAMADLASVGCRHDEAYARLQQAARTDALTGLFNHGAMQVRVREEIARARRDQHPLACVIIDLDDFKRVNDLRGHLAGDEYLRRVADHLRAEVRPYDVVARYGGDEFVLLLPGTDEAEALRVAERVRGRMRDDQPPHAPGGGCSIGVAEWVDGMSPDGLLELADRALLWAKRTGKARVAVVNPEVEAELARLHRENGSPEAVRALAAAIEARDNYTAEHSERVVGLAKDVALIMGMPADLVERIGSGALLHDVGKLAIPNEILHKAGGLTAEEWTVIAEHPLIGERILRRTPQLASLAPVVRHEHEHWDGSGYPDGLMGHRIPLASRIILACDAYVAMRTARPYRPALTHEEAVAELETQAGSQFDPAVVEALLDRLGERRLAG